MSAITASPRQISSHELKRLIDSGKPLRLVDVRTPLEFEEVRVAESVNLPLDELPGAFVNHGSLAKSAEENTVYLICRSGTRAAKASEKLAAAGVKQIVVVADGIMDWTAAGYPVVRSQRKIISLERQVRIAAGLLVLGGVLLGWLAHPGFYGLSGFVGGGLIFAGITDFCGMGLLLARLPYNKRPQT